MYLNNQKSETSREKAFGKRAGQRSEGPEKTPEQGWGGGAAEDEQEWGQVVGEARNRLGFVRPN